MRKKSLPIPPSTIGAITGVLFVSSLILSVWGRSGGPVWAQWLGPVFLGCMLLIPGILFLVDPQLSISWFRALKSRRRDGHTSEPLLWQRLPLEERVLVVIGIFVVSGLGVWILFITIPGFLRSCGIF